MPNKEPPELIPPTSVVGDPQRRNRLGEEAAGVVGIVATLAAVQKAIPGPAGKLFGVLFTGLEKSPETGKMNTGKGTLLNFAPSPLGYMNPEVFGLERNFYLPPGSTEYIPPIADRLGLGLRQQRIEDELRRQQLDQQAALSRAAGAARVLEGESQGTLEDLAAGRGGLTRAGVLIATSGVPAADLQAAAAAQLGRPATPLTVGAAGVPARTLPTDPPPLIKFPSAANPSGQQNGIIPPPAPGAPIDPTSVPPVRNDQQHYANNSKPPVKNLATERADP